jgi:hypothetical protein
MMVSLCSDRWSASEMERAMHTDAAENTDAAADAADAAAEAKGESKKRERSTIEFPYMDLTDAVAVAQAIHKTTGSSPCQPDQLAAAMGLSMHSSGFRMRMGTARLFGLIESDRGSGGAKLTSLGQMIVDVSREREGKAKAFLNVPLYSKLYEVYRGKVLPPTAALEREIAALGVAQKQTDRARQAFERSATAAGFFDRGRDRLVAPGIADGETPSASSRPEPGGNGGGGRGGSGRGRDHPLVKGLFDALPQTGEMSLAERARWLRAAEVNLSFAYAPAPDDAGEIEIKIRKGGPGGDAG